MRQLRKLTPQVVRSAAQGFETRSDFRIGDHSAYRAAVRYEMLDELFPNPLKTPHSWAKYTYLDCEEEAKKYRSRYEYYQGNRKLYEASLRRGWLEEFFPRQKQDRDKIKSRLPEVKMLFNIIADQGKTLREVADKAGVSVSMLLNLRNGTTTSPRLPEFTYIAEALGYRVTFEPIEEDKT